MARKLPYIEVIYYKLLIDKLYILNIYPFQEILKARIWAISEVLSAVSEDKSEVDFEAVRSYHKMRSKENGI